MSNLSVSLLFRAIDQISAPMRGITQSLTGGMQITKGLTSVTNLSSVASFKQATAATTAATAITKEVTAATKGVTANNALAASSHLSAAAFTRQASAATAAAIASAKIGQMPSPGITPGIGPGGPAGGGFSARIASARGQLDKDLMTGMTGAIVGTQLAMLGGVMVKPITKSISVAAQFTATMSGVSAVTNATTLEFTALDKKARELGRNTFFTATQVAEGMHFLGMAGFRANQIIDAMPPTLDMARAGAIDLGQAADIASNILTGFGLEADKMGRVADVLTYTFTTSNTNLSMLGESMKYVAPIARGLRIEIEETAAMVGLLGNAGIQGSQAGTTLRAGLLRLAAPRNVTNRMLSSVGLSLDDHAQGANEAASALAALGVESKDAEGNLRPIATILKDIHEATQEYGQAERAAIISRIFGMEAASGFMELVNQAGLGGLDKYIAEIMGNAENTASRVAKKMGANFSGAVIEMRSAWEGFQLSIGEPMGDFLTPFIRTATFGIRVVTRLTTAVPPLAFAFGLLQGGLGLTLLLFASVFTGATVLLGGLAALKFSLIALGIPVQGLTLGMIWLRVQTLFTAAGMRGLALSSLLCARNLLTLGMRAIPLVVFGLRRLLLGIIWLIPAFIKFAVIISIGVIKGLYIIATVAIPAVIAAIQWLNAAIFSIPIIGWILGITAALIFVGTVIYNKWEPIKSFFNNFFGDLNRQWAGFWKKVDASAPMLGNIWEGMTGLIRATGQTLDQWIVQPIKTVVRWLGWLGSFIGLGSGSALAAPEPIAPPPVSPPAIVAPATYAAEEVPTATPVRGSTRNRPSITNAPAPQIGGDTITFHITAAPGQDPKAIAQEVARILESRSRNQRRNQLTDFDNNT